MKGTFVKLLFMKFYVDDWKSEYGLALCSLSARGCWIEILGAMHQNGQTGVLAGTAEQLSRVCRCTPPEVVQAFSELRLNGVAEISEHDGVYTVVCRRMRRESKERAQAEERQKRYQTAKRLAVNGNKNGVTTENKRKINGGESETETEYNNKINNNTGAHAQEKRFAVPSPEQIAEYCRERKNGVDAVRFFDYYQSKGWMIGKTRMKDWKAAVRTWERNRKDLEPLKADYEGGGLMDIQIGG